MGESRSIREIVEEVVNAGLATHVRALKDELIEQACERLQHAVPDAGSSRAENGATDLLNTAINSVLHCYTQAEILGALLEGSANFATRAALFVVRSGAGTGWRAVGLEHDEGIKAITIDLNSGMAGRAYHDRVAAPGSIADFDPQFVSTYGAPTDGGSALALPLSVRDKVAAVLYADAGLRGGGNLDGSALQTLVHCTGMWLEIVAARKSGASPPAEAEAEPHVADEAAVETEPTPYSAPEHGEPVAAAAAAAPAVETTVHRGPASAIPPEEQEVHKKAKRFAKLLVDEIKLYNQAKVVEGRANKDIYARLKDDIDKSRATYDKRYGSSPAAEAGYFTQELIRILANDDPALLGSGFVG